MREATRASSSKKRNLYPTCKPITVDLVNCGEYMVLESRCWTHLDDEKHSRVRLPESEDLLLERRVLDGIAARRRCTRLALGRKLGET